MINLAKAISMISAPPLVAIPFTYAVILRASNNPLYTLHWTIISSLFIAVTGLFIIYGVHKGFYNNLDISNRKQRGSMFAFAAILTSLYMVLIVFLKGPSILLLSLAGFLLGIGLVSIINTRIKASIHMAVSSAFTLTLGLLYGGSFWLLIFFIPVVAWSRVTLGRHKLEETIVGTILGTFLVVLIYSIVRYIY